jgi:hypothetical protein
MYYKYRYDWFFIGYYKIDSVRYRLQIRPKQVADFVLLGLGLEEHILVRRVEAVSRFY